MDTEVRFSLLKGSSNRTHLVDRFNHGRVLKTYTGDVDMTEAVKFMQAFIAHEEAEMKSQDIYWNC